MGIDYDRQFTELTLAEVIRESEKWKRERSYADAKAAFQSAQRSEARGQSVAFAKRTSEDGSRTVYYVWSGEAVSA